MSGQGCEMDPSGKEAVRALVIRRLSDAGLQRNKRLKSDAAHQDMMRRLVDYLNYLTPASLALLAEEILTCAAGKARNEWPEEHFIRLLAEGKEARPAVLPSIVASWLASVEGPQAQAGGYLVEMFRHLGKRKRALTPYDRLQIKEQAADNRRTRQLISERQRDGIERAEDHQWLAAFVADERRALAIVEMGAQARAAKKEMGQ